MKGRANSIGRTPQKRGDQIHLNIHIIGICFFFCEHRYSGRRFPSNSISNSIKILIAALKFRYS